MNNFENNFLSKILVHRGFENNFAKSERIILLSFAFNPGAPVVRRVLEPQV